MMQLSMMAQAVCRMGPFEESGLVEFSDILVPLIAEFGEYTVIERCHLARHGSATARHAIDSVVAFFGGQDGLVAQRATRSTALMTARRSALRAGVAPADIVAAEHSLRTHFGIDDENAAQAMMAICFQSKPSVLQLSDAATELAA